MIERSGDMFAEYLSPEVLYVVTTNGFTRNDGAAVMGRGTALRAAQLHKDIPKILGDLLLTYGNRPFLLPYNFISLPVKHHWRDDADPLLIQGSLFHLAGLLGNYETKNHTIFMPRPGCGNGRLRWEAVKSYVEEVFYNDARVVIWNGDS